MNTKVLIMAALAVTFGSVSYFAGNRYLENQAQARMSEIESQAGPSVEMTTVVVAAKRLRFGERLDADSLRETPWPKEAMPEGAFRSVADLTEKGERKALKTIEPGEPILAIKITGANGHAGLAGVIAEGMRAVTIPVDLVNGVGGFVMPGDRVDIVLTRKNPDDGDQTAKIIMENVKVLSIDQDADRLVDGPKVAKSVTLETDAKGAQRLALANSVGRLSLLLRSAGDQNSVQSATVTGEDLDGTERDEEDAGFFSFLNQEKKRNANITVVRRDEVISHTVPVHADLVGARSKNQ